MLQLIRAHTDGYVLRPQQNGGASNLLGDEIVELLADYEDNAPTKGK
jgi:hypothetical protein